MSRDPYRYFRVEARELLDQLSKGVLDLEKDGADGAPVARLLRLAHTLKGAARVVKQPAIADLAHAVEDVLAPHREGGAPLPRARIDTLLAQLDGIEAQLTQLPAAEESAPATERVAPAPKTPEAPPRLLRADVAEVDAMLVGLNEIGSELAVLRRSAAALAQAAPTQRTRAAPDALRPRAADSNANGGGMGAAGLSASYGTARHLSASIERLERELSEVRDAAERLRLVPAAALFNALERAARDAAHHLDKRVAFEAIGGDVRLDAEVLDALHGALVQLVRNAVVHGIESAAERRAAGKPDLGRVAVQVERRGYHVAFRCSDDGRGVNLDAVRRAVQQRGMRAAETERLRAGELIALLLEGGITTSATVTELAGRGIGLDVVREAVRRVNGEVVVDTGPHGTSIELRVPLSLASLAALIIESDGQRAAIPLDAVVCALRVAPHDIVAQADGPALHYEGRLVPLLPVALAPIARLPIAPGASAPAPRASAPRSAARSAVIVRADGAAGALAALTADRLHGTQNIVLRPLPPLAPADPIVLGMHLDGEGNACLVLDPRALSSATRVSPRAQTSAATPQTALSGDTPILVIDDSLTTRMLETSILESAGYTVAAATSGEEAFDMARRNRYGLFLVDVEMPGMDGFEFVARTRADPALREVPCILVTSRDAAADRRRGAESGAHAYIVKSEFDQAAFLDRIGALLRS
jgi:two-component system chemotaxis sensor kinase CheA